MPTEEVPADVVERRTRCRRQRLSVVLEALPDRRRRRRRRLRQTCVWCRRHCCGWSGSAFRTDTVRCCETFDRDSSCTWGDGPPCVVQLGRVRTDSECRRSTCRSPRTVGTVPSCSAVHDLPDWNAHLSGCCGKNQVRCQHLRSSLPALARACKHQVSSYSFIVIQSNLNDNFIASFTWNFNATIAT